MSSLHEVPTTAQRLRMSWEEYLALPDTPKAEYADGEVIVSPPGVFRHGQAASALASVFRALPGVVVAAEAGLRLSPTRMRVPDVMVVDRAPDGPWVTEPPLLAAEVLSPSTRSEDTVRKSAEYADAGVGQFWVVDPDHRTIDVYRNVDGGWEPVAHLDAATPTAEVAVADRGVVRVDLDEVLPA